MEREQQQQKKRNRLSQQWNFDFLFLPREKYYSTFSHRWILFTSIHRWGYVLLASYECSPSNNKWSFRWWFIVPIRTPHTLDYIFRRSNIIYPYRCGTLLALHRDLWCNGRKNVRNVMAQKNCSNDFGTHYFVLSLRTNKSSDTCSTCVCH